MQIRSSFDFRFVDENYIKENLVKTLRQITELIEECEENTNIKLAKLEEKITENLEEKIEEIIAKKFGQVFAEKFAEGFLEKLIKGELK